MMAEVGACTTAGSRRFFGCLAWVSLVLPTGPAANATGTSIYTLNLTTPVTSPKSPAIALINSTTALNSDGAKHGLFDALVWAPNSKTGSLDLIVADAAKGQ